MSPLFRILRQFLTYIVLNILPQQQKPVGIIGAGSFGVAMAKLLQSNTDVVIFSRKPETVEKINTTHRHYDTDFSSRVRATNSIADICESCRLIMPMLRSENFRTTMQGFSPFLNPMHIIIHGTKGLDLVGLTYEDLVSGVVCSRANVRTMSEVVMEETPVIRVGCLSGPNLAREILDGKPTATLIASRFKEVVEIGKKALNSKYFHVFGSQEILGAEFAGALKNIIALGSGILGGKDLGRNLQAMLITRGLKEMIAIATRMGATNTAFFGTAGIGDLIATATATSSRNYQFGMRLAKGETPTEIINSMQEVAEGVRTLRIAHRIGRTYRLHIPIVDMLYLVVFQNFSIDKAINYLIEYPYDVDVDFV